MTTRPGDSATAEHRSAEGGPVTVAGHSGSAEPWGRAPEQRPCRCPLALGRHLRRDGRRRGSLGRSSATAPDSQAVPDRGRPTARPPHALGELGLLLTVYAAYCVVRVLVDADPAAARINGARVLSLEQVLGLDVEAAAAQWLVQSTGLSVVAAWAYAGLHYTVTPGVLLWLYRARPERYATARTALLVATCAALACYWLLPTAPPRLLAAAYPDVLAQTSDYGWWGTQASAPRGLGALTNQYAAMPSMHVGWAVWCGLTVAGAHSRALVRGAALSYPALTALVVVATANHYVLDAVAGAVIVVAVMVAATTGRRLQAWRRTTGRVDLRRTGAASRHSARTASTLAATGWSVTALRVAHEAVTPEPAGQAPPRPEGERDVGPPQGRRSPDARPGRAPRHA